MTITARKIAFVLGALLVAASWLCAIRFLARYVGSPSAGWQGTLAIAAAAHVLGWTLAWLGLPRDNLGLRSRRAALGCAGALAIVGAVFVLLGVGQYGQWREYRNARPCPGSGPARVGATACIAARAAVVESIRVDTSTPSQYHVPDGGQELEVRVAGSPTRRVSVLRPPWVPYRRCGGGPFSELLSTHGIATCHLPVTAHLYRGRVAQLTLPGGRKTETDQQPGRYRLVTWFGVLWLLGALWPLLPVAVKLGRAGSLSMRGPKRDPADALGGARSRSSTAART
ncbi:MAG: hypothetical protein M3296_08300 [Actinomycetota bacterium]|nr:hypothetical protein [Actinomycetota bacterium]